MAKHLQGGPRRLHYLAIGRLNAGGLVYYNNSELLQGLHTNLTVAREDEPIIFLLKSFFTNYHLKSRIL
jgi:hypothetical protein